jgi:Protein of unknown function (DUF1344)
MRVLLSLLSATAFLGTVYTANAADATGAIKSIDTAKDMITLDNGSTYMVPKSVKLSEFKVGEKVTVSYSVMGKDMDATAIKPAT